MTDKDQAEKAAETIAKDWSFSDRIILAGLRFFVRNFYGLKINGTEHFNAVAGKPTLIIGNHTSYADAAALAIMLPFKTAFVIDSGQYQRWMKAPFIKHLMKRVPLFPIDTRTPYGLKSLTKLAKMGMPVMIFPEGMLTRTGTLMQIFDGAASVAESAHAQILPIHLENFHMLRGMTPDLKHHPKKWRPDVSLNVGPVRTLDIPEGLSARERRAVRYAQLKAMMHEIPLLTKSTDRPLIDALRSAAHTFGRKTAIIDDVESSGGTYGDILLGAYALDAQLRTFTDKGEAVGVLLPNSKGSAVTFFALQSAGRVAAMLNPKAGAATMQSCVETACVKTVLTSRRFVELGKLQAEVEALSKTCRIVYLEDVKARVGLFAKVKAVLQARGIIAPPKGPKNGHEPAVILFTSGSEGVPKGVVLNASNFLSNIVQVRSKVSFGPDDKVFNAMPLFHSFGLMGGLIMPLLSGVPTYQYPTPLDGKIIPKAVYFSDSTIMFGTDTFLNLYARTATGHDFGRVRMIVAGAERLKQETYDLYVDRFGVRPIQGYGMTEASPVVAMNTREFHRKGTVGQFLPGMEIKFDEVPGITHGKRLSVRGPNIMLGYMKHDNPGVIQPPQDGWHDTGDIIAVDADGYVSIAGRAGRFAKIGGEMVSLDAVEIIAKGASAAPTTEHAIVLKQDPKNGDSLVLFTTDPDMKREQMVKTAQGEQKSILGLPRDKDIFVVPALPKLPTGKTNYVELQSMLLKEFTKAASGAVAAVPKTAPDVQKPAP